MESWSHFSDKPLERSEGIADRLWNEVKHDVMDSKVTVLFDARNDVLWAAMQGRLRLWPLSKP